jgi:signal transduction histidine kinase/CheY-like chemotaxis protein
VFPGKWIASIARRIARIRAPLSIKLQGAFLLVSVFLLITALVSLLAIARIEQRATEVDRLDRGIGLAQTLEHSIAVQQHLSSMMLMTADSAYHPRLIEERQRFRAAAAQLTAHGLNPAAVTRIEETFARYEASSQTAVRAKQSGDHKRAEEVHSTWELLIAHDIEALLRDVVARMQRQRGTTLVRITREQRQTNWMVGGCFVVSISLALGLGMLLARSIVYPIQRVDATLSRIAGGEFVSVPDVVNRDELGSLVSHVDRMSGQLADLYARERQTTRELQAQVESVRRTQAQLIQSEKHRALGEMAAGVAHDFNNRLAVVLGQAEFSLAQLDGGQLGPAEVRRRLEIIRAAALEAAGTVRRLLEFTRATPHPSAVQPLDVEEVFASVLRVAEPRWKDEAHARGRPIEVVTDFRPLPPLMGNAADLREVLVNLVFNALDAMPHGGTLTVSTRRESDAVCLAVQDTGVGMPEEVAARVFEPFFTTKGPQRSGLGLSVSYGIVRRYDGNFTVESRPGRGATFTVRLPLRLPALATIEPVGVPSPVGETGSLRILVIDDEDFVRETLRDLCRAAGHHVWEAHSGREALSILAEQPLEVVCTDLGMPGMTGWQLAEKIRAEWPELTIVLITGWGAGIDTEELAAHGVDFLLAKPFRRDDVLRVLSEIARTRAVSGQRIAGMIPAGRSCPTASEMPAGAGPGPASDHCVDLERKVI